MMRWDITALIDPFKCFSIGKNSSPLLLYAFPAPLSTSNLLDHGYGGVMRAVLDRHGSMLFLAPLR